MNFVAKKPAKPEPKPDPLDGMQINVRLPDARLADALDAYAERHRRSRNMAIVLLLEAAMKEADLWPPS